MKAIYVEAFSGISGNMFLGGLLNLGVPMKYIADEIAKMHLGNYEIIYNSVNKCGIEASYFNVLLAEEHVKHDSKYHVHIPDEHSHRKGQEHLHNQEIIAGSQHHHEHRNLADITKIINESTLKQAVKEKALKVFNVLAVAEAHVHGKPIDEVHFHEVGAIDTIIDIVGSIIALEYLQIEKVYVSRIQTGCGFVQCAHGLMPIPAPATAEILKNIPYYHGNIEKELVTPTGAALMAVLAEPVTDFPNNFSGSMIGYGAGTWNLSIPNVVRINLGEINMESLDSLIVAECNIDDMSGELYPFVFEKLLTAGAVDVWVTPIIMKKGRPAHKLSILASADKLEQIVMIVLKETSSLGLRYYSVQRKIASRKFINAEFDNASVAVKVAAYNEEIVNFAPEYEDCRKIAEKTGKPLKNIMQAAIKKAEEEIYD
ncbi:MAG: nickel pincer cofactor biosynthesis protein LarC [Acholeplasmataceae bacterium]|nr:nickel pincer cofactor biosynthesis protein LarC [Acholeplasmataceae bacterium]